MAWTPRPRAPCRILRRVVAGEKAERLGPVLTLLRATSGLEPSGNDCGHAGYQGSGDDAEGADKGNDNEGEIPGHGCSGRTPHRSLGGRQVRAIAHRSCVVADTIRYGLWLSNATRCGSPSTATPAGGAPVVNGCSPTSCKTQGKLGGGGRSPRGGPSCGRGCRACSVPTHPTAPGEPPPQWPAGATLDAAGCKESHSAPHATARPDCHARLPRQALFAQAARALGGAS